MENFRHSVTLKFLRTIAVRVSATMLSVILTGTAVEAADAARPWEWSLEERLAARFDPAARQTRLQKRRSGSPQNNASSSSQSPADSIHGNENPELLLPSEIFRSFIRHAYTHEDEVAREFRRDASAKATASGLPANFLETLEQTSADYIVLERKAAAARASLMQGAPSPDVRRELSLLETEACRARAAAISALRQKYRVFDRYLYSAVAPAVFFTFDTLPDPETLRHQEGGCR